MTKIEKNNQIINPFGGINIVLKAIDDSKITELIDNELGSRNPQAIYSHSDLIKNLWSVYFCGGDVAEDINEHLRDYLQNVPNNKVANADTILGILKSLKTDNQIEVSNKGNVYEINKNDKLNTLNISILKHLKVLKEGHYYDFDYDNEILKTEKKDAKNTYKKCKGYFPGMATISGTPVYFENRDGNMNVKTGQADVLERAYKLLNNSGIKINRSRMDAGSYTKDIVDVVAKNSKLFYIRANRSEGLTKELLESQKWETIEINKIIYEVCSLDFQPFASNVSKAEKKNYPTYRLVVSREKTEDKQIDLLTGDNMKYRSILTNDYKSSEKEVIEYYNKRGAEEKVIDIMNPTFRINIH